MSENEIKYIVLKNIDDILNTIGDQTNMTRQLCFELDEVLSKLGYSNIKVYYEGPGISELHFRNPYKDKDIFYTIIDLKCLQRSQKLRKVLLT